MSHYLPQLTSPSDCPSNLKEAIDWILRVTGKDGQGGGNGTKDLAGAVEKLLKDVKASSPELGKTFEQIKKALRSGSSNGLIDALGDGLNKFKEGIQNIPHYKSAYNEQSNWDSVFTGDTSVSNDGKAPPKVAAKIFLGCVPMIFYGLSYLYWRCSDKGGWKKMMLNDGDGSALKNFMEATGFDTKKHLNPSKSGADIATVLQNVNSFKTAISVPNSSNSFAKFLTSLQKPSEPTNRPISALSLCAQAYFTHKRSTNSHASSSPPSSIRTMLYWLPGLTITPQFGELLEHFDSLFTDGPMPVAISGSQGPDTLSANDLAGHLVTSCISSVPVLRSIQGRSVSDDPLLHYTYRNSEFAYPSSGSALFNALSKYTYALQFQLYFLYRQCSTGITTCGWWLCKFGSDVFPKDDTTVPSSFCGSVEVTKGSHDGNKCGLQPDCPSPLQAFLTDNLKGFRRDPSDPYSHLAECTVGSMCHVPMGFKVNDLRGLATGGHLMIALNSFCGKSNTPLTKMRHTLSCITKRTPRTLSDVFGFTFHLTGQMFHEAIKQNDPTTNIMSALQPLISKIPDTIKHLFFDVTSDLQKMGSRFFDLSLHCHKVTTSSTVNKRNGSYCDHHTSEKAADLASLSGCTNGKNCGKYLEPLAVSSGATFANYFASTYLTWALYLTDDIYESFQEFLDRFNSLKCTGRKNCKHDCSHPSGTSTAACSCPSVVDCSDVLPHLYAYGFSFHNAYWLKGRDYTSNQWNDNDNKRNCASFHDQLHSVISGNPLSNLLTSIDTFLYAIRWEFFSKLSGFWTIYVCIILYTFFFLLDTLHLRSHFKLTSSHTVPPLALLTSGKPLPVTKLTYIAQ